MGYVPYVHIALRSETDVFTLLPATSTSETARVLIRTDGLIRRKWRRDKGSKRKKMTQRIASARMFYGLDFKKEMVVFENLPQIREMRQWWRKRLQILRPKEINKDLHAAYLVNTCEGKDLEFYSDWIAQFINTLAWDVIKVLDSRNYFFQSYRGKHSSLHVWSRPLSRTASRWLDSLAYMENITDV